jgi:8-oxo-dGTP pyrophosphatase MutT (NUDIX family)
MKGTQQPTPWQRISSRPVYENPWFRVREDRVIRPDGSPGIFGVVELPEYAGVVAVDNHGRVALVRQWRYLYGEPTLEIPAGNATPSDASPIDVARRELLEETGLVASTWISLGRIRYSAVTNVGHLFLARNVAEHERPGSNDDWTELIWLNYSEAPELVLAGEITESTSLGALMKAEGLRQRGEWSLPPSSG